MRNYDLNPLRGSSAGSDQPLDFIDATLRDKGEDKCPPRNIIPLAQRAFPPDTTAIIYRPARSAMTSGKANTRHWKLRFEQRTAPFIEPLMGWTGGTDTLSQVELDFPTAEAAIACAKRQGIHFVVQGLADRLGCGARHRTSRKLAIRINWPPAIAGHAPASSNGWNERAVSGRRTTASISIAH